MADERSPKPPAAPSDPDLPTARAAILARRQRFIAVALSGFATTTACAKGNQGPEIVRPDDPSGVVDVGKQGQGGTESEGARPGPCLSVWAPSDDEDAAAPHPCLEVNPTEHGDPLPAPCLKMAPPPPDAGAHPTPCLKMAMPRADAGARPAVCLRMAPPKPAPTEAPPRPCLTEMLDD